MPDEERTPQVSVTLTTLFLRHFLRYFQTEVVYHFSLLLWLVNKKAPCNSRGCKIIIMIIKSSFSTSSCSWTWGLNSLPTWWWGLQGPPVNDVHSLRACVGFSSLLPLWLGIPWMSNNYRFFPPGYRVNHLPLLFFSVSVSAWKETRSTSWSSQSTIRISTYQLIISNSLDWSVSWIHFHLDVNKYKYAKLAFLLQNSAMTGHMLNPRANLIQSRKEDFAFLFWAINILMDF